VSFRAFGLDVSGPFRPADSLPASGQGPRRVQLHALDGEALDTRFESASLERLAEVRDRSGRLALSIDRAPTGHLRLEVPGHGRCLVDPAGGAAGLVLEPAAPDPLALLVGQALPIAAALQGLEPLHASGVVVDGGAIAFAGPSGAGKSSLAAALVRGGADLLADDVVALELLGGRVLAHPGLGRLKLAPRAGAPGAEKVAAPVAVRTEPTPLRTLCLVEPDARATAPALEPLDPGDPRPILGSTFVVCVRDPARLARQLAIASAVADGARVLRLRVPSVGDPLELGAPVRRLLETAVLADA